MTKSLVLQKSWVWFKIHISRMLRRLESNFMTTKIWRLTENQPLPEASSRDEEIRIIISTNKSTTGELISNARCIKVEGYFEIHRLHRDFNETVKVTNCRVTEKAVRTQHEAVLLDIDNIKARAIKHYNR